MSEALLIAEQNQQSALTAAGNAESSQLTLLQLIASLLSQASRKIPLGNWANLPFPGTVDPGQAFDLTASYVDPGTAGIRPDLATTLETAFQNADAASRAMVDNAMTQFVEVYFPDLGTATARLDALLLENSDGIAISEADRATLAIEVENAIDDIRRAAQQDVMAGGGNGFDIPQPTLQAMLNNVEIAANDQTADSRTKVNSSIIQLSVQVKQSAMGTLASVQSGMRGVLLQYGGLIAELRDFMLRYGSASADAKGKEYELELEEFASRRQAAQMAFETEVRRITTKMDLDKTVISKRIEAKRLEIENLQLQLDGNKVPYQARLQTEIKIRELETAIMNQALHAQSEATHAIGRIAEAFASASQATSSVSTQE